MSAARNPSRRSLLGAGAAFVSAGAAPTLFLAAPAAEAENEASRALYGLAPPEMAVFEALGRAQGWAPGRYNDEELVHFDIETSATDEVSLALQDHGPEYGGLALILTMYPEEELRDATPQQMAVTAARWLRDTAARLEAAAGGAT